METKNIKTVMLMFLTLIGTMAALPIGKVYTQPGGLTAIYLMGESVDVIVPSYLSEEAEKIVVYDMLYDVVLYKKAVYTYNVTYFVGDIKYLRRGVVYMLLRGDDPEATLDVSLWDDSKAYTGEVGKISAAELQIYLYDVGAARFNPVRIDEVGYGYVYFEL